MDQHDLDRPATLNSRVRHALVDRLWNSDDSGRHCALEAQARLIAAYEARKWPRVRRAPQN